LAGALIAIGDALSNITPYYLSRAPLLELLFHLRNGVAHGNKFNLTKKGLRRLHEYDAHNGEAQIKTRMFQIRPTLKGQSMLFDFMGPGDFLDLLQSVEVYLTRIRERRASGELLDDGTLVVRQPRP
jgi:hypothetical protein